MGQGVGILAKNAFENQILKLDIELSESEPLFEATENKK
jgi:hypothetical protein